MAIVEGNNDGFGGIQLHQKYADLNEPYGCSVMTEAR